MGLKFLILGMVHFFSDFNMSNPKRPTNRRLSDVHKRTTGDDTEEKKRKGFRRFCLIKTEHTDDFLTFENKYFLDWGKTVWQLSEIKLYQVKCDIIDEKTEDADKN